MGAIEIIIPGKPIAKKRPRFARIGKGVRTYSDQETEEGRFLLEARAQVRKKLEGPLVLQMAFFVPRPRGHYGTGKNAGNLKPTAPQYPVTKPDLDNYEKFVMDCLNGLAWGDDSQIVQIHSRKRYAGTDGPRTTILVMAPRDEKGV